PRDLLSFPTRRSSDLAPTLPVERGRFGLPDDRVLLAAFNNSYKFDAELLDAWVAITRRAPRALLVNSVPAQAEPHLRARWAGQGDRKSTRLNSSHVKI